MNSQALAEFVTVLIVLGVVAIFVLAIPALGAMIIFDPPTRQDCMQ